MWHSRGCSRRRYFNCQAGENYRQNTAINKDTWLAAGYVSADYPRCERLFKGKIFKFKLPPKPVPKIDLQEWNDMRKLMEKLQKQSQAMKSTQQEISSLQKQLSETTGFFKGKARKSLEGKIEQAEKQEKRIHTDMEQTVKQAGYPDVQSFAKTYQKSEKLVREYNEELRAWANQTEPKKEKPSEPPKKASIREKLYRYQQESRQQPNSQQRRNIRTENDEKGGTENEENNF